MDRAYVIALQSGFGLLLAVLIATTLFAVIDGWAAPEAGITACQPGDAAHYIGCYFHDVWPAMTYPQAIPWLIWFANLLAVLLLTVPVQINLHQRQVR